MFTLKHTEEFTEKLRLQITPIYGTPEISETIVAFHSEQRIVWLRVNARDNPTICFDRMRQ